MLVLEVSKPPLSRRLRNMKYDALIALVFLLIDWDWGVCDSEGIWSNIIWSSILLVFVLFARLFGNRYDYPYKVMFLQDYVVIEYIKVCVKFRRIYRYKNIEVMTEMDKNKQFTSVRHTVLIYSGFGFGEDDGWSQENQLLLIDTMKSKGVVVTILT